MRIFLIILFVLSAPGVLRAQKATVVMACGPRSAPLSAGGGSSLFMDINGRTCATGAGVGTTMATQAPEPTAAPDQNTGGNTDEAPKP